MRNALRDTADSQTVGSHIMRHSMNKLTYLLLITFLFASYSANATINQKSFAFPDIVDTLKTADNYYSPTLLTTPINLISTIQKFGKKADLLDTTNDYEYFVDDYNLSDTTNKSVTNRKGLSIFVDTTREVSVNLDGWGIPPFFSDYLPDDEEHPKSKTQKLIDSVNFAVRRELWKANKTLVRGFPVYIFNPTKKSVRLEEQDGRIMMIQEALDTNSQWTPIEVWKFSDCGNSYGGVILRPNYYIMTKIVKYKGPYKTLLRLKMINNDEIIYSKPFKGSINLSQTDTSTFDRKFRPIDFFNLDKSDK